MKQIPLSQGKFAIVDDEDFESLSQYKWYYDAGSIDARRSTPKDWNRKALMHRDIMNPPPGFVVDHINHDRLDNRRENLRVCSQQENLQNHSRPVGGTGFVGVKEHKKNGPRFQAWISLKSKTVNIGLFETAEQAARARDAEVVKHYGKHARLNFQGAAETPRTIEVENEEI